MLKKFFMILIVIILIVGISSSVNATDLKTSLDIIQKASEIKYLENDQGYISKTIIDSNSDKGEVTIELKVSNTTKETETEVSTEVFLVVDNSPSMDFITSSGESRKKVVLNSASKLVESIFSISRSIKVGLIDFHGSGLFEGPASIYNASVKCGLTDKKDYVLNAIDEQLKSVTQSGTNIQAGLKAAEKNFSANAGNKVIILLTDGVPNADIDGNNSGNDVTTEDAKAIQETTKQTLLDLKSKGIYTITMLTGMDETDKDTDGNEIFDDGNNSLENNLEAAQRVFGTEDNPIADKYYLAKSADINSIITDDILQDVTTKVRKPMNEVKIVDYFPEDITKNFEFSYVGNPSIGTTSDKINTENNTITWNIGTLKGDEVATLKYKLKIKDMKNEELLNKIISTNEKVVLTYTDSNSQEYTVELTSSPKIQLSEVKEDSKKDPTTANGILPQTGINITIAVAIIGAIMVVAVIFYKKYNNYKDIR